MIDKELLDIMICPLSGDRVRLEGDRLVNVKWGLAYPIRNGIPVMLVDEAELPAGVASLEELKAKIAAARGTGSVD